MPSHHVSGRAVMSLMPWTLGGNVDVLAPVWPLGRGHVSLLIWPWPHESMPDSFQWVGGPWSHGPLPAKAPVTPAASLVQLGVIAIPLGGANAGLVPTASLLQSIQLLPHTRGVLAAVTAFGAGGGRVPEVLGNGSMAAPGAGVVRGPLGPAFLYPAPKLCLSVAVWHCGQHLTRASRGITGRGGVLIL